MGQLSINTAVSCRLCQGTPAMNVDFHGFTAAFIVMETHHEPGPLCRECGTSIFRRLTALTLSRGWWGPLAFFRTPVTVFRNALHYQRLTDLPMPRRPEGGTAVVPPERGLWRRPAILGVLVPTLVAILGAAWWLNIEKDSDTARGVGSCIVWTGEGDDGDIVDCDTEGALLVFAVADTPEECPAEAVPWRPGWYSPTSDDALWYLCLKRQQR